MIRYASKQISLAKRNIPIKKTVTKKSFAGVSVNQRDKNGLNVLAKAAELVINKQLVNAASNRNISEVENLLARGADVNARNNIGYTALDWAARKGKTEVVKALVIAGADVNATDNDGWTALQFAKKGGHYVKVKKAIEEGKQKLISLYEHSLHPEVTQECLNVLLGEKIRKHFTEIPYFKQIFDYANSKRLSIQQIDQVNKYIEERASVTIQKERSSNYSNSL